LTSVQSTKPTLSVTELHRSLVEIPSLSREEGPIADYLEHFFRNQIETIAQNHATSASAAEPPDLDFARNGPNTLNLLRIGNNLCLSLGDGPRTLLMNSHLDVVPPPENHPDDPFKAVEQDGMVYGRGSVDAKASVSSMIVALLSLARDGYRPRHGKVILALTVCEEMGGVDNGLETILPVLPRPDAAIVGEPTEMEPCIAQKGLLILRMISIGETAHAARAALGINAIEGAAEDIMRLKTLKFDRIHSTLGEVTMTVTTIEGGTARNVVPDRCVTYLDIRTTPEYEHQELVQLVQQHVKSHIEVHSERLVPVDTSASESIVRACIESNPGAVAFGSPTLSDWIYLKGIPTVKMGPGDSRFSHRADEHVAVAELHRGVAIYRDVIQSYFQHP
jgi:acetylornithine deacetylase